MKQHIKFEEATYNIEATVTQVKPNGHSFDFGIVVDTADVNLLRPPIISEQTVDMLSWVHFIKQAVVNIRHPEDDRVHPTPYGLPKFPFESLYGQRVSLGETLLVTDRNNDELKFAPVSQIVEQQHLPDYTRGWFSRFVEADTHYFPDFYNDLLPLLDQD